MELQIMWVLIYTLLAGVCKVDNPEVPFILVAAYWLYPQEYKETLQILALTVVLKWFPLWILLHIGVGNWELISTTILSKLINDSLNWWSLKLFFVKLKSQPVIRTLSELYDKLFTFDYIPATDINPFSLICSCSQSYADIFLEKH